jgi:hypothetical protein
MSLKGKKVLFIGVRIHDYEKKIIFSIEQLGASVTFFQIYSRSLLLQKWLSKVYNIDRKKRVYYSKLLTYKGFDYVLVIQGFQIDTHYYDQLKMNNPTAKFINYHWDSLKESYQYLHIINYFDKVYSFDPHDCKKYEEIKYLPLFYINEYSVLRSNSEFVYEDIDVLFIGSWRNKERYRTIRLIKEYCRNNQIEFYSYLYVNWKTFIRSLFRFYYMKNAKLKSLKHPEIVDFFKRSKVIIDLPSSFQQGLTMRTFETLGAGKKLITTNVHIKNEPFYDESYIKLIDLNDLDINKDFINNKNYKIDPTINNFTIQSFVNALFNSY